jgi:hypothetical protein
VRIDNIKTKLVDRFLFVESQHRTALSASAREAVGAFRRRHSARSSALPST